MPYSWDDVLGKAQTDGQRWQLLDADKNHGSGGGVLLGQRSGSSLEYKSFRDYQPGDDIRHVDWDAYGRSDKLSVRLYHEEVVPRLDVVIDHSRSMACFDKAQVAWYLAGVLGAAAQNSGWIFKLWLAGEDFTLQHLAPTVPAWEIAGQGTQNQGFNWGGDIASPRGALSGVRSMRVLISDLLWQHDSEDYVNELLHGATGAWTLRVVADEDVLAPKQGTYLLQDAETNEEIEVSLDEKTLQQFNSAVTRHREHWSQIMLRRGGRYVEFSAERGGIADLVEAQILGLNKK